jgi:two-component system sensor histidine kinase PilS (NtrC family)
VIEVILSRRLKWLTLLRVLFVSLLFGATVLFNLDDGTSLLRYTSHIVLYYITTVTFTVSFVYLILLRILKDERSLVRLTYFQVVGDVVLSAALVAITGGTDSVFTFFFSLVIFYAAIILYRRGALLTATASTLLFLAIGLSEMGVLPESLQLTEGLDGLPGAPDMADGAVQAEVIEELQSRILQSRIYNLVVNIVAFYSIAMLASYLAEQVRRESEGHRQTRHSLEDLQALHRNIVQSLRSGLVTISLDGKISFFNAEIEALSAERKGDLRGADVRDVFPALRHILGNPDKHELLTTEVTTQMIEGRSTLLQWSISPLLDGAGDRIGQVLFVQDVTRIRNMEEQIKRAEQFAVIGELAARIAHEIRNPLASISGCIQMLDTTQNDEETSSRLMGIVLREVAHLNVWINEFLEFSRPPTLERQAFDLVTMINETAEAFRHDEAMRNTSLDVTTPEFRQVQGDPVRMKQVLWNLLKNSSQAMPFGGTIRVDLRDMEHEGQSLVCTSVQDEGTGISPENLEKIFEPFFTTKQGGTGLGLATSFRIVQEHGGSMEVESVEGRGSTFNIYLPQTMEGR